MSDEIIQLTQTEEELRKNGARVLHQFGVHATYCIHTHDFYELFLVSGGSAIHAVNGHTQIMTAGSFVLMRPNDVHKYEVFRTDDFELLDIGIPSEVFHRLCHYLAVDLSHFHTSLLPPHRILSGSVLRDVEHKLLKNENPATPETGYSYMLSLFPYFVGLFLSIPEYDSRLPLWLSHLLEQMDHPENYISGLPRLLALANVSQEHLTRSFRRYLGISPTTFINAKRLDYAAELLLRSDLSVIEIASHCGFNSQSHFYKLFTKRYGTAPQHYRIGTAVSSQSPL